ncbi:MAG: hypothetical protein AAF423_09095 [Pseudomonadota bacterium]
MTDQSPHHRLYDSWQERYAPYTNGFFVPHHDPFDGSTTVVVRQMVVDLQKLNTDLQAKCPEWTELHVYADVIVFPAHSEEYGEFGFLLGHIPGQKATFVTRCVAVADGDGVFINRNPSSELNIYCSTIDGGDLHFFGIDGKVPASAQLKLEDSALGFRMTGSQENPEPLRRLPDGLVALGTPAYWLLQSSFNVASGMSGHDPDLATSILSWTSLLSETGDDLDCQHLALNAANLKTIVEQQNHRIPFVPPLTSKEYKTVVSDYLNSAVALEDAFQKAADKLDVTQDVDGFVAANKGLFEDKSIAGEQLVDQMRANVAQAEALFKQNQRKLDGQIKYEGAIDTAKATFEAGVKKYKKQKEEEAINGAILSVVEVGAAIGEMAAGNEAAVGEAAQGAEKAAKAAKATAETVSKMKKLFETMKKIAEVVKKLGKVVEALNKARKAIEKVMDAHNLKVSDFGKGVDVKNAEQDGIFDNAYWDVFTLNVKSIFEPLSEIEGSAEYLKQLEYLAVYGKAVYTNQVALVRQQQALFRLVLETRISGNQKERLQKLVESAKTKEEACQIAKIISYQELLRVKARIVVYMNEQAAALRYWSVEPSLPDSCVPKLGDSAGSLHDKMAEIDEKHLHALERFVPHPQPMNQKLRIDDPELMEQMRTGGAFSFLISPTDEEFAKWGRVRIAGFRIFVNDEAVVDPDAHVSINVSTSGHYYDHYKGPLLEYVSPFSYPFEYAPNDKDNPVADGKPADDVKFSYFEPTPFTNWTFELTGASGLNLEKLKYLEFHLTGGWASVG